MSLLTKHAGGKYLRSDDLPGTGTENAVKLIISNVTEANVARQDQQPEYKAVLEFEGDTKPMVLNATNLKMLIKNFGTEDENKIIGKVVSVYVKDDVEYQGEVVMGLRILKSIDHAEPTKKDEPPTGEPDDDIPF